jgi:hypothetical protein
MKVALYIYTESLENNVEYIVNNFKNRVIADGGVFEADSCCVDVVQSLGGSFDTYTTSKRIELYDDEKISLTSSIQNVNDISKVFTDYSQSFTIPASDNNNEIFRHWYENSLDNGFDQRVKYDGYIELDTQLFRTGKWQLESASVKNNRIEDYKITFYGNLKALTDKFGEDMLSDVRELNDFSVVYSPTNVRTNITSLTSQDVRYPLISSKRIWGTESVSAESPLNLSGSIDFDEFFPAVRVSKIFKAIENKYNLSFTSAFFEQERWKRLFVWFKKNEAEKFVMKSAPNRITFPTSQSDENFETSASLDNVVVSSFTNNGLFTLIVNVSTTQNLTLSIYKNGEFLQNIRKRGTSIRYLISSQTGVGTYHFEITNDYSATSVNYTYTYKASQFIVSNPRQPTDGIQTTFSNSGSGTFDNKIDLCDTAPEIKVSDFFSGILKTFNLTCYSTDGINFSLEQLENYYYLGTIRDYSEYCVTDIEYQKVKPYKKIDFKYQKSEAVLNRTFFDENKREYGDLMYTFENDGSDFKIQLPFENLLFNRFNAIGTNINYPLVSYAVKPDLNPYKPKPVLLYEMGNISFNIPWYIVGTAYQNAWMFTQDDDDTAGRFDVVANVNTLNWGVEQSAYYEENIYRTLFSNYYLNFLNNLYSKKSRLVKVKMRLPYAELLDLKLNDRIVIRDKRYIINQYTTDLTTFESDFELIQDFRSINFDNSTLRNVSNQAVIFDVFTTSKEQLTWSIVQDDDSMLTGISFNEFGVKIDVKENTSGLERTASILSDKNDLIIVLQDA